MAKTQTTQTIDDLLKVYAKTFGSNPVMVRVEAERCGDIVKYSFFRESGLYEETFFREEVDPKVVLNQVGTTTPPKYESRGVAEVVGGKFFLTAILKR